MASEIRAFAQVKDYYLFHVWDSTLRLRLALNDVRTESARLNLDLASRFCLQRHYEGAAFRDRNNPMLK